MKKLFVLLLALLMIGTAVAEGIDLSGMSYDDLITLRDQIDLAIWNSEEWQEVTVPQGRWVVGEDIPAGTWTIKCAQVNNDSISGRLAQIEWGESIEDDGDISYKGRHGYENIYNPDSTYYESGDITEVTIEFQDGDILDVDTSYAAVVFTPYAGKPSLGFK